MDEQEFKTRADQALQVFIEGWRRQPARTHEKR